MGGPAQSRWPISLSHYRVFSTAFVPNILCPLCQTHGRHGLTARLLHHRKNQSKTTVCSNQPKSNDQPIKVTSGYCSIPTMPQHQKPSLSSLLSTAFFVIKLLSLYVSLEHLPYCPALSMKPGWNRAGIGESSEIDSKLVRNQAEPV